jgi:hypothetical protein
VSADPAGHFVPSGLYICDGHEEITTAGGRVVRHRFLTAAPGPWKTLAQIQAQAAPLKTTPPRRERCPMCLTYLPLPDDAGHVGPCVSCGFTETVGPAPWRPQTFAAPDTLGRAVALKQSPGQVAEYTPTPVKVQLSRVRPSRETYGSKEATLAGVLRLQRDQGLRPPDPYTELRVMASAPCGRCGTPDSRRCTCPPAPPTLDDVLSRQNARSAEMEAAQLAAGYPAIHRVL